MDDNSVVKKHLEDAYDIPFEVNGGMHYDDAWYRIKPSGHEEELFDIEVRFKNQLRLIIEVKPEKYAAFSIKDMSTASEEKKELFAEYARQLSIMKAKTDFFINDTPYDPENPSEWPSVWKNYRLRVSRSPIVSEEETFNQAEVASSWAIIVAGMFLSLLNVIQTEDDYPLEGGVKKVEINKYERNPLNRELCLAANGYKCKICGFDFEAVYGDLGYHFIHVHHIKPVSESKEAYKINPTKDMIPVCPNCHAMLHQVNPPLMPDDLVKIIEKNSNDTN